MLKACEEKLWKKQYYFYSGTNVLHYASLQGNLRLVKSLIECGCDKEIKSKFGGTALYWASENDHLEVVQYLISVGANKEAKSNDGSTPLIEATFNGYLEVVKYLISVGANKEAKDNFGSTPLIWASRNGHLEIVQYLISVGANKEKNGMKCFYQNWHFNLTKKVYQQKNTLFRKILKFLQNVTNIIRLKNVPGQNRTGL
ncbi:hypothetical protein TVAG_235140 [Trichomonas vaginalis G3]|uniref:Uncharacterized protein n=1 Tax=Trichomonas vaginalis (strain ATCC PRA-98 / G3) TaxID=412133 RepID=A2DPN2_TRIV3|nr:hypothetical protein TVAG_235140 [Trichomonas vaginalis G3]|eukprot:XP_001329767.1 hypothetical protein [Trichomonas vaginalis G3]